MSLNDGDANSINGTMEPSLRILIVGAGIGGLSAALALRQQGHQVSIYESSKFSTETGAAIHLAPNANGILKRMGISAAQTGANECESMIEYTMEGKQSRLIPVKQLSQLWQHKWLLAHRVRLHDALRTAVTETAGRGRPAELHLSSPAVDVDSSTATLYFQDGSSVKGDVVIGADGVHSVTRSKIPGGDKKAFGSGKSAFRFLISRQALLDDPSTCKYAETVGQLTIWYGPDRRIVMYPTSNNTLLNFVCIHPETESVATGDWNTQSSKLQLLRVYKDFHQDCLAVLSKADEESLKVWKLLDMDVLSSWVDQRLALLGDAAHPFLPHQGQGGACAIEDAVALGVVLERGLSRDEIPERLKLYEQIRKERADRLQQYSRNTGEDLKDTAKTKMVEYTNYNFGHDEFDNATQRLREWKWSRTPQVYWRMPITFGPMPGPRQSHNGLPRNGRDSTFTTASIKIKTSRTVLQNLLPPGKKSWRFKSPGTVAYCSFSQTTLNKMEWLGGSGYSHLGLYIHGIEYEKQNGEVISGTYLPILFESLTDPIISGREELGMPKLYSSIDIERDSTSYSIRASWQGMTWGNFHLCDLEPVINMSGATGNLSGEDSDEGIFAYRYIPKVGRENKGQAEADYAIFESFADAQPKPRPERAWISKNTNFSLNARDWMAFPTLHHIIARFEEIPVYEIVGAKVVEGFGVPDVAGANRIE